MKTITREAIVTFIKANEHRSNPGSTMPLRFSQSGSCEYVTEDNTPSCVIGNVLVDAGFDLLEVENSSAETLFHRLGLDSEVGRFATDIQGYADRSYTWGTALQLVLIERGEA